MAVPHVAAAAALYLEQHPQATPAEVHDALINGASSGLLDVAAMLQGTPNRYLYSGAMYSEGRGDHTQAFGRGQEAEMVVASSSGPRENSHATASRGAAAAVGVGGSGAGRSSSSVLDEAPDGPKLLAANGRS